ncbi:MAG: SHOCT domain-containing protein [Dehalococcoidaceae bacterium]|nr:SHOCT domain-containing protein [Dehalococcoidaceae bacterium]
MWGWYEGMGWWMTLGGLFSLLFLAAVIALIVWGVKKYNEGGGSSQSKGSALDIAKERYAKGEISKDEFEQIKKDLS